MEHPDLPGRFIRVAPQAAAVHALSGWVEAPETPEPPPVTETASGDVGAADAPAGDTAQASPVQPASRRRFTTTSTEE